MVEVKRTMPNDIAELAPEFKIMLQATNRSPRTIGAYMAGVDALRAFMVGRGMPTAVDAAARLHVEAAYAAWSCWLLAGGGTCDPAKGRALRILVGAATMRVAKHMLLGIRRRSIFAAPTSATISSGRRTVDGADGSHPDFLSYINDMLDSAGCYG